VKSESFYSGHSRDENKQSFDEFKKEMLQANQLLQSEIYAISKQLEESKIKALIAKGIQQKFTKPKSKAGQLSDSLPQTKSREPTIEVVELANSPVRKSVLSVISPKSIVDDHETLLQDLPS
jgi:hypothetical protein